MVYLNWKDSHSSRETVDELDRKEFETAKAFRVELSRLCAEYRLAGMDVYVSSRKCGNWK